MSRKPVGNVRIPIASTIDLLTVPAADQKDFFLWQPYQNTLEAVYLGAADNVTLTNAVTVQLIQRDGPLEVELNTEQRIESVTIDPIELNSAGPVGGGPVFLRVKTTAFDRLLFVTVHALSPEIP